MLTDTGTSIRVMAEADRQEGPAFFTLQECADTLRVSPRTVTRMIQRGDLRAIHVGRQVRIWRSSVVQFAARNKI